MVGIGPAGSMILPHVLAHPHFELTAICDRSTQVGDLFAGDFDCFTELDALLASDVECVVVTTPTELHAAHAIAALEAGKHVIVEKPVTVTLAEADAIAAAVAAGGSALIVGHSQSYEPAIQLMRAIIEAGTIGPLRAINALNYTDWMQRPRADVEFDRAAGGGVVFRQGAHHFDIMRYLAGGSPVSLRAIVGDWSDERPGDGAYSALFQFPGGAAASLFYSGYDHFSAVELTFGIDELGRQANAPRRVRGTKDRRMLAASQEELLGRYVGGGAPANFGLLLVSCAGGDMRITPDGVRVDHGTGSFTIALGGLPAGRTALLDELAQAIAGRPTTHDIHWARANLELSLKVIESSDANRELAVDPGGSGVRTPDAVRAHLAAALDSQAAVRRE